MLFCCCRKWMSYARVGPQRSRQQKNLPGGSPPVWTDLAIFANLASFYTSLVIFWRFILYLAKLWTYFGNFLMLLGKCSLLLRDKEYSSHLITLVSPYFLSWREREKEKLNKYFFCDDMSLVKWTMYDDDGGIWWKIEWCINGVVVFCALGSRVISATRFWI